MEQETKQKPWTGIAAGVLVLCLILSLALSDGGARAASAGAVLELPRSGGGAQPVSGAQVGDKVVPLGRAVGIKLFSDGVLVVGLSAVETDSGPSSPGRTCGLKAGDIITHINGQEVNTIEEVQDILGDEQGGCHDPAGHPERKAGPALCPGHSEYPGQLSAGRLAEGFHGRNRYHDLL